MMQSHGFSNSVWLVIAWCVACPLAAMELPVTTVIDWPYLQHVRLHDQPIDSEEETKFLCMDPAVFMGPHIDHGITIFANEQALTVTEFGQIFPLGSVLTKEKKGGGFITVMEKVAQNGTPDDWSYSMWRLTDGTNITVEFLAHSKQSCVDCHAAYRGDAASSVYYALRAAYGVRARGQAAP